jgi:hypothetical protein
MANGVNDPVGGLAAATQPGIPAMTPEFLQQLQQGAATVGNAAQSGGLSSLFAPGTLSQLDPLYNYAKTAPIYDLAGNASTEQYRFQPLPDTKYRLVVNKDVIGEASTPAEAARLAELYNQYSSSGGNNIYVAFQKETPTADAQGNPTTTYIPFFENQNEKNRDALFQSMMMAAGAIMGGAALGPALGGTAATATAPATAGVLGSGTLAGIAGTGLGTAAGTFAGGIGSGVPLDEALKRAAISGVTAGVLKGVMPGGGVSGDAATGIAGTKLNAAGQIVDSITGVPLSAADIAAAKIASTVAQVGATGTPAAALAGNVAGTGASGALQTVTGSLGSAVAPAVAPAVVGAGTGAILGAGTSGPLTTVTGTSPNANIGAALPAVVGTTPVLGTGTAGQQVTVSGQTDKPAEIGGALPAVVGTTPVLGTGTAGQQVTVSGQTDKPAEIGGALPAVVGTTPVMGTGPVGQQVTVSGQTDKPADIGGALPAVVGTTPVLGTGTVGQQVTVSGETNKPGDIGGKPTDLLAPVIGEFVASDIVGGGESLEQEQAGDDGKKGPGTIATVTGGLAILDALSKLLEGGGGRTGGAGTGLESLAPTFRAQLPTPRGQFAPQALTQRDRSDIDYARYGYGPARSFFNYVPETAAERAAFAAAAAPAPRVGVGAVLPQALPGAPTGATTAVLSSGLDKLRAAMPGASDAEIEAFLATPEGQQALVMIFESMGAQPRAKGGKMGGEGRGRESFAVNGEGTGRSDEIPALLSDGEYVIDAETVALLGDGSSKAGAKRLNDFRVNIRKHKGRNLAKGKFSVNARRPERYLSGGQV